MAMFVMAVEDRGPGVPLAAMLAIRSRISPFASVSSKPLGMIVGKTRRKLYPAGRVRLESGQALPRPAGYNFLHW